MTLHHKYLVVLLDLVTFIKQPKNFVIVCIYLGLNHAFVLRLPCLPMNKLFVSIVFKIVRSKKTTFCLLNFLLLLIFFIEFYSFGSSAIILKLDFL